MDELIIDVRQNEHAGRERNPHVPWSPAEIAADAVAARDAGASIVHFHARDPECGNPSSDPILYCDIARRIRAASDVVMQPTLGGGVSADSAERVRHVIELGRHADTHAELVPFDLASTNISVWDRRAGRFVSEDHVYLNPVRLLRGLAKGVSEVGTRPIAVAWNVGSLRLIEPLIALGVLREPLYVQLVVMGPGVLDGHPATERGLDALLDFLPQGVDLEWGVMCFGASLLGLADPVLERGGHLALGLGDHAYVELGMPTNAELVERVVARGRAHGREPASPELVRRRLALARPPEIAGNLWKASTKSRPQSTGDSGLQ